MNHEDYLHLLAERTTLQQMIAETPAEDVLDRGSLVARLEKVQGELDALRAARDRQSLTMRR